MEKDSKSGLGGLSGNGLIAVMLLVAGVLFVREAPLETTRLPANEPRFVQLFSLQDIDARLWQDPFGAVARSRAEARKNDAKKAQADDARRTAAHADRFHHGERAVGGKLEDSGGRDLAEPGEATPPAGLGMLDPRLVEDFLLVVRDKKSPVRPARVFTCAAESFKHPFAVRH